MTEAQATEMLAKLDTIIALADTLIWLLYAGVLGLGIMWGFKTWESTIRAWRSRSFLD